MGCHRPLLFFLLVGTCFSLICSRPAMADEACRKCPKRDIAVFGIAVPAVADDASLGYGDWVGMHLLGGGLLEALFNEDASRGCLNFVDAQMAVQGIGAGGAYQHGMGGFPAPAGAIGDADYIITGEIAASGAGASHAVSIRLETAASREVVATAGGTYDFSMDGGANGKALAKQLMPLMEKIRAFERRKREEVPAVAIDVDEGVTITPARDFIKAGETVKIRYRLEDCDGEPLKGRIFAPFATLGFLDVKQPPQTDDQGQAELTFIAGDKSGTANLSAEFQYLQPFGREDTGGGAGLIQIVDHSLWASVTVQHESHYNQDDDDGRHITKKNSHRSRSFSIYFYFEPKPFRTYYADGTMTPVRFKHRLAGFMPGRFNHYASGTSYEALRYYQGLEWSITSSWSEMAQAGGIKLYQEEIDFVTYEVDPKSGAITKVDLPRVDWDYRIIINRQCEKVNYEKGTRQDCSDKWDTDGNFHSGLPSEAACEEIAATGPTMVSGMCRVPHEDKHERRSSTYEWEFHRE